MIKKKKSDFNVVIGLPIKSCRFSVPNSNLVIPVKPTHNNVKKVFFDLFCVRVLVRYFELIIATLVIISRGGYFITQLF